MIPESVPGQAADLTMILMSIVASVRQNEIGIESRFQRLEPGFYRLPLLGKKSVAKRHHFDLGACRFRKKLGGGTPRFALSSTYPAQNAPKHIEANPPRHQTQQRGANTYFDIV
jgi:hypothetical protein